MKRVLNWIGGLLGIAGILFVILRLAENIDQIDLGRLGLNAWTTLIVLAAVYGSANIMLARAWWWILGALDVDAQWKWALRAYGISQLAKYLPGNLFHLAGRQAICQAAGFPAGQIAKSAVYELVLVAAAGMMFAFLAIPLLISDSKPLVGLAAYLAIFAAVVYGIHKRFGPAAAKALCWQSLFLATSGFVFIATLSLLNANAVRVDMVPLVCGAYVISWLAGLLTPGAPAGIGVREAVSVILLGGLFPEAELLLAVVLARIVTMFGDLGFFAVAGMLRVGVSAK